MRLSEYSDEDLLNEVLHRGFKIEMRTDKTTREFTEWEHGVDYIKIGGVTFDISN